MIKYSLYPTLLDKFQSYQEWETEAQKPWNKTKDPLGVKADLKQSLLDSINRVPFSNEVVDKGTAFNAIIDCYVNKKQHEPTPREPYSITSDTSNNVIYVDFPATDIAEARHFAFDRKWCIEQAKYFKGALNQIYVSGILPTKYGDVELHGLIDEIIGADVYDIKTTSRYSLGKYRKHWQRYVYPYCLIASEKVDCIKSFEYTAFELRDNNGVLTGFRYPEYYRYDHEATVKILTNHVENFIEFLEENRELITDTKIFVK